MKTINYLILSVLIFFLSNCKNEAKKVQILADKSNTLRTVSFYNKDVKVTEFKAEKFGINLEKSGEYNVLLKQIKSDKISLKNLYLNSENKQNVIDSVSNYLLETLLNKILPFWYNMPWSMSGYSAIPQVGEVGCSYLVANTLLQLGFNINRFKIGQAASWDICKTFQLENSVIVLKNITQTEVVSYVKENLKEGFYTLGLDCHAGYLLYYHNEVFIVHSSWYYPGVVVIEFADYAPAMQSGITVIGEITTNEKLIIKWLNDEFVEVRSL